MINKQSLNGRTMYHFAILLISFLVIATNVSGMDIDNQAYYNETTKIYTIENLWGIGEKLAEIELITPINMQVGLGEQYVAEFEFRDYDNTYGNAFQDMNFYQINSGMKEFTREFEYRYLDYETDVREVYGEVCEDGNCTIQEIGEEEYQKEIWTRFSDVNELPQQNSVRVRIYTDVKVGDYVEWIPTFYGEYLEEWATWSGNLSTSLTSYYFFNDTTGNLVDYVGSADMTEEGTVPSDSNGIISNARGDYSDSNYFTGLNATEFGSDNAWAISMWFNVSTNSGQTRHMFSSHPDPLGGWTDSFELYIDVNSDEQLYVNWVYRGDVGDTYTGDYVNDSTWHNVIVSRNASGADGQVYVDGVLVDILSSGASRGTAVPQKEFGRIVDDGTAYSADGISIDEAGIWSRGLTSAEAGLLYNSGSGCEYNDENCFIPIVTLNSPADDSSTSSSSVLLNGTGTAPTGATISNVSVYTNRTGTWDVLTTQSGISTSPFTKTATLNFIGDGAYIWNMYFCDSNGDCAWASSNYTVNFDSTAPSVVIDYPTSSLNYNYDGGNETLNWTISDAGTLDTCWYSYNETNTTVTCGDAGTTFPLQTGVYTLTMWANDSVGNTNSSTITWVYDVFENSRTYETEVIEFSTTNFTVNLTLGTGVEIVSGILHYGTTNDSSSITSSGDNRILTSSDFQIPNYDVDTNVTFYWTLTLDDATELNLTTSNQTVLVVGLDNCSSNNYTLFNVSLYDEETLIPINGTMEVYYYVQNKPLYSTIHNFSAKFENVSNTLVCSNINLSGQNLAYSSEIRYYSSGDENDTVGYAYELYHIQKADIGDYPNISLYDLHKNESTEFKINYQDSNIIKVADAVVQLQRKYISENVYRVVEAPLTSSDGTAILHIDLNANKYKVTVVKDGEVLDIFDNLVFVCQSPLSGQCEQNLYSDIDPENDVEVQTLNDFSYTLTSVGNNTITLDFSIPSGTPSRINFVLYQYDQFGNNTLCNKTIISSAGSTDCTYNDTLTESYLTLTISKDGVPMVVSSYIIPEAGAVDFLGNNFFIVFIFILSIIGMAFSSPEWIILNSVVVIIISGSLWLLNGLNFVMGLGGLAWLLVGAGILIFKLAKQEDR